MHRLILIEGMIGAGKSRTARNVANWIESQGEPARIFHEFADDHPIRTKAVDRIRAASPEVAPSQFDDPRIGLAQDPNVYSLDQWGALAARCLHTRQITILEATFLQNSVLPSFANDAPLTHIKEAFTRIEQQIAPAQPLLVYLRPRDIDSAIRRVHLERGDTWASWNIASVAGFPWAQHRNLSGRAAVVELYRAWECVVDDLMMTFSGDTLLVADPQDNWEAALARICSAVAAT